MRRSRKSWVRVTVQDDLAGIAPEPTLAVHSLPKEWSDTPTTVETDLVPLRTVRRCMPFFDALTLGMVLPLPFDATVKASADGHELRWQTSLGVTGEVNGGYAQEIHSHDVRQHDKFVDRPVLKVLMPYYVESSPDLLVFYGPLINRTTPLVPFSGVVNHGPDGYRSPVNIVCRWEGGDSTFTFKRGEPLAQLYAVPKAVAYSSGIISDAEARKRQKHMRLATSTTGAYKKLWRFK